LTVSEESSGKRATITLKQSKNGRNVTDLVYILESIRNYWTIEYLHPSPEVIQLQQDITLPIKKNMSISEAVVKQNQDGESLSLLEQASVSFRDMRLVTYSTEAIKRVAFQDPGLIDKIGDYGILAKQSERLLIPERLQPTFREVTYMYSDSGFLAGFAGPNSTFAVLDDIKRISGACQ